MRPRGHRPWGAWQFDCVARRESGSARGRPRGVRVRTRSRRLARHLANHPAQLPHPGLRRPDLRRLRRVVPPRGGDRRAVRHGHRWARPVSARRADPYRRLHVVDGRPRHRLRRAGCRRGRGSVAGVRAARRDDRHPSGPHRNRARGQGNSRDGRACARPRRDAALQHPRRGDRAGHRRRRSCHHSTV